MRELLPIACAAAAVLGGCAHVTAPDGPTLLGRSHGAEESLCYSVEEVNEQVLTGAWPRKGANARPTDMLMYGRPVTTVVRRTQCGPQQKLFEIDASNAPGARIGRMVVAQNGTEGWRYLPDARRIDKLTFPSSDMSSLNWLALVLSNYEAQDIRLEPVAGVPAWHLRLQPRHPNRPVKQLWLDADSYLPLRQEMWGPDGRLLSATQVTARPREITAIPAAMLAMPIQQGMGSIRVVKGDRDWRMSEEDLSKALGCPLGRLGYIPAGFAVAGVYLYSCPDTLGRSARWELTDGVATVNVIQTRVNVNELDEMETPQDVHGPIQVEQRGPFYFMVRGILPEAELERMAKSITLEGY